MGALSQSVWSSGLKEVRGRLLVNLVPMLEQKKNNKKHEMYLFLFFFFKLGKAQRCHSLGSEKYCIGIVVGNGSDFSNLINKRCD